MLKNSRILPTAIVALVGAVVGSFVMMLYASSHFAGVATSNSTPPVVSAAALSGGSDQQRIIDAVRRAKASVVAIDVTVNGRVFTPADPFFQQFFGQAGPGYSQPFKAGDSGSGFVYDRQGDIITNAHVVNPIPGATASDITVVFLDGHKEKAHIVGANVSSDIAVLRLNSGSVPPPLALANSDTLEQGQWAIAIGEPFELQSTVTLGVVSAFNRTEQIQDEQGNAINFKGLLQTSAPINSGNSGGPLIDINGNVIGVNQSTLRGNAQGIGFAIPSNTVKSAVASLLAHPGITQGTNASYIGVFLATVDNGFRQQTGYRGTGGVGLAQVISGGPADNAGLQPGDVILSVNGKTMGSVNQFQDYVKTLKPGTKISLQVWSQGRKKLVTVTTGERPAAVPQQP